jgi:hypothetical protein
MRYATEVAPTIDGEADRHRSSYPEITDERFWQLYARCSPYSLLRIPGFYNLYQSAAYVARNRIAGDFVECGCLFAGASIFAHLALCAYGAPKRAHLFDTFTGCDEGGHLVTGERVNAYTIPDYYRGVQDNIADSGCELAQFTLTRGKVEHTLPGNAMGDIAILRLDTDLYSSTRCELDHLYPKLVPGGVLIVDDYGMFRGARAATDEYFAGLDRPPLLNRIDNTVWAGVKPAWDPVATDSPADMTGFRLRRSLPVQTGMGKF